MSKLFPSNASGDQASALRSNATTDFNQLGGLGTALTGNYGQIPGLVDQYKKTTGIGDSNSYGLTPAQQSQLNQETDALTQHQDATLNTLRAEMGRRGISDPGALASMEANIRQNYGGLVQQHQANFAENARAQRETATQNLMQYLGGLGQTGLGAIGEAGQGQAGLGGQLQADQNNKQNQANALWGDIFNTATFAAGGGFSGGGKAATAAPANLNGTGNSMASAGNMFSGQGFQPDYGTGPYTPGNFGW